MHISHHFNRPSAHAVCCPGRSEWALEFGENGIWSSGGHARACIDVIETTNQFEIAGLIEKDDGMTDDNLVYPVLGNDNELTIFRRKYSHAFITVGQVKSPNFRISRA